MLKDVFEESLAAERWAIKTERLVAEGQVKQPLQKMGRNKGDPELENTTVCVRVLHKELENTFVDFFFS